MKLFKYALSLALSLVFGIQAITDQEICTNAGLTWNPRSTLPPFAVRQGCFDQNAPDFYFPGDSTKPINAPPGQYYQPYVVPIPGDLRNSMSGYFKCNQGFVSGLTSDGGVVIGQGIGKIGEGKCRLLTDTEQVASDAKTDQEMAEANAICNAAGGQGLNSRNGTTQIWGGCKCSTDAQCPSLLSCNKTIARCVPMVCNGKKELCNRPYNKIAQIDVHNATSTTKHGFKILGIDTHINPVADQNWDLQDQLDHGLRVFKLPIHPVGKDNTPWVTHSLQEREIDDVAAQIAKNMPFSKDAIKSAISSELKGELWQIDTSNIKLIDVLNQLKAFLDSHPYEVITLELNTFDITGPNDTDRLQKFLNDFKISGIDKYIYKPDFNNLNWPTLGQMIANNQRLVLLCDSQVNQPGFIYTRWYTVSNNYGYKSLDALKADDSAKAKNGSPTMLFNMTHSITGPVAGSPDLAKQANQYDVLHDHIQKSFNTIGRYPNLISVDFVDIHFDDIKRVIDELNSKEW